MEITRLDEEPVGEWVRRLADFVNRAHLDHAAIEFYYLDKRNVLVPQRFYRFELDEGVIIGGKKMGTYKLLQIYTCRQIIEHLTYGVYVIELNGDPKHVYVGESSYAPRQRMARHLAKLSDSAKVFKRGATGKLRPDLFKNYPRYSSQISSKLAEAKLAAELRRQGFKVEGGH